MENPIREPCIAEKAPLVVDAAGAQNSSPVK
jgi:hypothetical protein